MDALVWIAGAALIVAGIATLTSGLLARKVITLQSDLINRLGDKLCANSDYQLERIKAETDGIRAYASAVRPRPPAPGTSGWVPPSEGEIEIPARG